MVTFNDHYTQPRNELPYDEPGSDDYLVAQQRPSVVDMRHTSTTFPYRSNQQVLHTAGMAHQSTFDHVPSDVPRHGRVTPAGNPYQDLLVPSIEPPSPDGMHSSFVHTLPHRHRTPVSHFIAGPTVQPKILAYPQLRDPMLDDNQSIPLQRRVVSDDIRTRSVYHEARPYTVIDAGHDRGRPNSGETHSTFWRPSIVSNRELDTYDHALPSAQPGANRILVHAPRPGEQSNPVLMEDRGGFFERIPAASRPVIFTGDPRIPVHDEHRLVNQPHRVVSWQEGSRILHESRNGDSVEIIPVSRPRMMAQMTRDRPLSMEPYHSQSGLSNSFAYEPVFGARPHPRNEDSVSRYTGPPPEVGHSYSSDPFDWQAYVISHISCCCIGTLCTWRYTNN